MLFSEWLYKGRHMGRSVFHLPGCLSVFVSLLLRPIYAKPVNSFLILSLFLRRLYFISLSALTTDAVFESQNEVSTITSLSIRHTKYIFDTIFQYLKICCKWYRNTSHLLPRCSWSSWRLHMHNHAYFVNTWLKFYFTKKLRMCYFLTDVLFITSSFVSNYLGSIFVYVGTDLGYFKFCRIVCCFM
jgi:hypothetical protein